MHDEWIWWLRACSYAAFASIGGALGHLLRNSENGKKITLWETVLAAATSGFVGFIVLFICQELKLSDQWTGAIVGVCGWLGASATIAMLERLVRKRLGLNEEATHHDSSP